MCRLSRKSGSLNLLEPSGLVQACNWDFFTFALLHLYVHTENQQTSISQTCPKVSERGIQIMVQKYAALWRIPNFEIRSLKNAFAQSRKATIASSCLSVRPHASPRIQTGRFSIKFSTVSFYKNLSRNSKFAQNRTKKYCTLTRRPKHVLLL